MKRFQNKFSETKKEKKKQNKVFIYDNLYM